MNALIEKFIQRPVLSSAFCIFIFILGVFGLIKMPLRFLPKMNQALIEIKTEFPGANSQTVKHFVTSKIQSAIVGVDGIDYITSSSMAGMSDVKINLFPDANPDRLLPIIIEKINSILGEFPNQVKKPSILKQNTDDQAMLILGFSSDKLNQSELSDYLHRIVEPQMESVEGISKLKIWGNESILKIELNPQALTAYHVIPIEIVNALKNQNVLASPGKTQGNYFNYTLNASTTLHTPEEFLNIVIKVVDLVPIYLKDVAEVTMGSKEDDFDVSYNEKPTTMMGIVTSPSSNPLSVVNAILKKWPSIKNTISEKITMKVVLNRTDFIRSSLDEVVKTLFESILIVILVIFIFLGNVKAALIPAITIPLSLVGMGFFMNLMSYSINTITLLAMVLGVGLVVDDAIVVIENIVKHLKHSISAITATMLATKELISPVISMTITLAAVYIPIGLTGGLIGQLFKEFAFTLAGSVVISGVLALLLVPMMSAHFIKKINHKSWLMRFSESLSNYFQEKYRVILLSVFRKKILMLILWLLILIFSVFLYIIIPSELVPNENQGFLLTLGDAPSNANLNYLKQSMPEINNIYSEFKEINDTATVLSTSMDYTAYLLSRENNPNQKRLLKVRMPLQFALSKIPELDLHVIAPSILPSSGTPIQFVLRSTLDEKTLYYAAKKIEEQALASGLFMYLFDDLNYSNPEATILVNSKAAASLNVSMNDIAQALSTLMSHQSVQAFSLHDQTYDVVVKTLPQYQLNPEDLQNITVRSGKEGSVLLSSVATIQYGVAPMALNQFQKMNSVTIMGAPLPGQSISEGLHLLSQLANKNLTTAITTDFAGSSRQFLQEGHRMLMIFALAIIVIFLVLSMQFESYRDSLIILLGSVPMTLFAALLPLKCGLGSINVYTQIGLLTLVGLISKHGILITRFANEIKQERHLSNQPAVIEAAIIRLRPILMTTAAILLGALPLMMASGAGSESRRSIGMVIGFGISMGTVLTLILLPIVYTVIAKEKSRSP